MNVRCAIGGEPIDPTDTAHVSPAKWGFEVKAPADSPRRSGSDIKCRELIETLGVPPLFACNVHIKLKQDGINPEQTGMF